MTKAFAVQLAAEVGAPVIEVPTITGSSEPTLLLERAAEALRGGPGATDGGAARSIGGGQGRSPAMGERPRPSRPEPAA